jgi:hypothetical protein
MLGDPPSTAPAIAAATAGRIAGKHTLTRPSPAGRPRPGRMPG